MKNFFICLTYLTAIGIASFLCGRLLPGKWFQFERFPWRGFSCEQNGKAYHALAIQKWKGKLPDMSRILPFMIQSKKMPKAATADQIRGMIEETCIAELVHGLLCIIGFGCVFLWDGEAGWIMAVLYMLGNFLYMSIQRYNRIKLVRIVTKMEKREKILQKKVSGGFS